MLPPIIRYHAEHLVHLPFGQLGRCYQRYRQIMDHWESLLPGRVVDVGYEELVADFEPGVRRVLTACGLGWDDRCLRFYENPRMGTSASSCPGATACLLRRHRSLAALP
jgi:hypothetical protein